MADIPKKRPSPKGPPPTPAKTVNNLDKPDPAGLAPLNFKVPAEFRREFKTYAAQRGTSMLKLLIEGFELYKQHHGK
jgi:hypothetical protein